MCWQWLVGRERFAATTDCKATDARYESEGEGGEGDEGEDHLVWL